MYAVLSLRQYVRVRDVIRYGSRYLVPSAILNQRGYYDVSLSRYLLASVVLRYVDQTFVSVQ